MLLLLLLLLPLLLVGEQAVLRETGVGRRNGSWTGRKVGIARAGTTALKREGGEARGSNGSGMCTSLTFSNRASRHYNNGMQC
jgi:hypothetical protein